MEPVVAFYQLNAKFVDSQDTPAEAKNIIYYSLAIGHHVGVLDCFNRVQEIGLQPYKNWINRLPPGEGRQKLAGLTRFGEIEIRQEHVGPLLDSLNAALPDMTAEEVQWSANLSLLLQNIVEEPLRYLLVRVQ